MDLYASGVILGERDRGTWTNRESGEITAYSTKIVDVYDPISGPGQLLAPVEMEIPATGTSCTFRVSLQPKSGYVRDGKAGEAKVDIKVTEIIPDEVARKRTRAS